ncbi:glycosyltransferase family 2 protein [Parasediminibacterium paludis]|uniref:Glycosyltransferase family 2 protein n=1 Tax=Parasediminibacterium paludis TaxID=908966 RepID=A0ABV8PSC5_9BACT
MSQPFISICIPAYKRITDLERLLNSIAEQTYQNFEVIITDDSPDDTVKDFVQSYNHKFSLLYFKNAEPLGTPENWNEGFRKANGKWFKLMHDDDYFANNKSLKSFVQEIEQHPSQEVFYSAFMFEDTINNYTKIIKCNIFDRLLLHLSPYHLLKRNYFGNPSCIIIKRTVPFLYDKRFKYIVDFAYYIELLLYNVKCRYIDEVLIYVGQNDSQVTHYTFKNKAVQMYENHILFEKIGSKALKNILAFDYYWRIYRNFQIQSIDEIREYYNGDIHPVLRAMIQFQKKLPKSLLTLGIFSKSCMFTCYCITRKLL